MIRRGWPSRSRFARAYADFDRHYHLWTQELFFDQKFLTRDDVSRQLSRLLTRDARPEVEVITAAWTASRQPVTSVAHRLLPS